jgi:hypothetical protein
MEPLEARLLYRDAIHRHRQLKRDTGLHRYLLFPVWRQSLHSWLSLCVGNRRAIGSGWFRPANLPTSAHMRQRHTETQLRLTRPACFVHLVTLHWTAARSWVSISRRRFCQWLSWLLRAVRSARLEACEAGPVDWRDAGNQVVHGTGSPNRPCRGTRRPTWGDRYRPHPPPADPSNLGGNLLQRQRQHQGFSVRGPKACGPLPNGQAGCGCEARIAIIFSTGSASTRARPASPHRGN